MKNYIYITLILCSNLLFSQGKLSKADKLYNTFAYSEAALEYENYIKQAKKVDVQTLQRAGDAFYYTNEMRKASLFYEKAYNTNNKLDEPYLSRYVRSLRGVRDYEKANAIYLNYLKTSGDQLAMEKFKEEVNQFNKILETEEESRFTINNLNINTEYSDFGAMPYGDQVVFSSSRPGAAKEVYTWNKQPYLSLYIADVSENGELVNEKLLSKQVNSNFHDATVAFSPDMETAYFTSTNINRNRLVLDEFSKNHFKLYRGNIIDGKIENIEELFFNSDDYSVGHPFVSEDGKYLFFASDMPGGYGGADIYYSEIFEDGMISTPINVGENINTSGNDFFPSLSENKLYFSSNGHLGFGGLDIFESQFSEEGSFSKAVNLGKVVNTSYDDFAIYFNKDKKTGYFSSNRQGGKGDDDMYFFYRKPLPCDQYLSGNVTDKKNKEILAGVTIRVKDSLQNTIATVQTDEKGNYEVKIPCDTKAFVTASKEEYVDKTKETTTGDVDGEHLDPLNFELDKLEDLIVKDKDTGVEKINLETIYFEFDKAEIREDSKKALDKAVEVMDMFPDMQIKIESHTDSRGAASYNLNLSDRRAKATREYLYSKGIAKERIASATGFGETKLLNHCADGVKCSDEEHELNRRSDFIILKR